jgi:hypothetical protein
VQVLDAHTLVLPDRPGNRRIDSLQNIVAHPGVGLIFFVPGIDETVRVNGTAVITTDPAVLAPLVAQGKLPNSAIVVTVREAYYHCAKALIRSKLWDPETRIERSSFPSLGRILVDQIGGPGWRRRMRAWRWRIGRGCTEGRKRFFFEKKKQKTFVH